MASKITITLSPYQARVLWGVIDGAMDAGACEGGLEPEESEALNAIDDKLLKHHPKWKDAKS